jgi:predicted DNA-binding transcriptional regulator AlpA
MKTNKFDLLSPKQVEADYGIPVGTQAIWRSTKRYAIPYIKLGRLVRFDRATIETWLASRTVNGEGTNGAYNDWE